MRARGLAKMNYPGQPAQSLLARAAPLLIRVRAYNHHMGNSGSVAKKDTATAHEY